MSEKKTFRVNLDYIDWLMTRIVRIAIMLVLGCVLVRSFFQERAFQVLEKTLLNRIYLLECRMTTTEEAIPALQRIHQEDGQNDEEPVTEF